MTVTKAQIGQWLENRAAILNKNKEYLTQCDASIGDADHSINMRRGCIKRIV